MKIIGLCGRIGSGKSSVARYYANKGYPVINADEIARQVVKPFTPCLDELVCYFGNSIIDESGALDRKKLAEIAFSNPANTQVLNEITHKYILDEIYSIIDACDNEYIFIDAPLLFESKLNEKCDRIIGVICSDEICVERASRRDNISPANIKKRLENQHSNEFLEDNCTDLIYNNSTLELLFVQADRILDAVSAES